MSQTPRCRLDMGHTLARHDARSLPTTWTSSGQPTKNGVLGIPFLQTCREAMSGKSIVCSLERLVVMPFPRRTSPEKLPPPMTSRVRDGIVVVGTPGVTLNHKWTAAKCKPRHSAAGIPPRLSSPRRIPRLAMRRRGGSEAASDAWSAKHHPTQSP
jgi:hypothetical protein